MSNVTYGSSSRFYSGKNIVVPLSLAVLPLPICNSSPWECLLLLLYPDAGIHCCMGDQSMPLCLVGVFVLMLNAYQLTSESEDSRAIEIL